MSRPAKAKAAPVGVDEAATTILQGIASGFWEVVDGAEASRLRPKKSGERK